MKAADDGSPGTTTWSSSSSSTCATVMRSPSRSNGTRARRIMRSVWSRLMEPSVTVVEPDASIPAISTQDFTWALGTGRSYSMPVSVRPADGEGREAALARLHARAHPLERLGDPVDGPAADRLVAVERPDARRAARRASPAAAASACPRCPTFMSPPVASSGACRPTPRINTPSVRTPPSTPAPSVITASSVERVSSESR